MRSSPVLTTCILERSPPQYSLWELPNRRGNSTPNIKSSPRKWLPLTSPERQTLRSWCTSTSKVSQKKIDLLVQLASISIISTLWSAARCSPAACNLMTNPLHRKNGCRGKGRRNWKSKSDSGTSRGLKKLSATEANFHPTQQIQRSPCRTSKRWSNTHRKNKTRLYHRGSTRPHLQVSQLQFRIARRLTLCLSHSNG